MKVFSLLTRFRHHKPDGGYKRLITELRNRHEVEVREFGNDETLDGFPRTSYEKLQASYKWLAEWNAWRHSKSEPPDAVHVMYGEEYFRFSHRLFPDIPVLATFHQPAEVLEREVTMGNHGGRVAAWTHRMNSNRFHSLSAAIVTNPDQRLALKPVMPVDRIHLIPLGVDVLPSPLKSPKGRNGVLTLGNWFRDWETYLEVVRSMPDVNFHLVNRQLPVEIQQVVDVLPNCQFYPNLSDAELSSLILRCACAFLPLQKLAGSNALLECLAGGLPIVMSNVNASIWQEMNPHCVALFQPCRTSEASNLLRLALSNTTLDIRKDCTEIAKTFSWESVALQTYQLYQNLT